MSEASREMTLKEWVEKLPDIHLARKEFKSLESQLARKDKVIEIMTKALESISKDFEDWTDCADEADTALAKAREVLSEQN